MIERNLQQLQSFIQGEPAEFGLTSSGINHLLIEPSASSSNRDPQLVFVNGLNVLLNPLPQFRGDFESEEDLIQYERQLKDSNYSILPQIRLAEELGVPVHTLAQYAVSSQTPSHRRGLYSEGTNERILDALKEISGPERRTIIPVTHSLSTFLGIQLLDQDFLEKHKLSDIIKPGVLVAPFTTTKEALRNEKARFGQEALPYTGGIAPSYTAFSPVKWLYTALNFFGWDPKISLPFYPLFHTSSHLAENFCEEGLIKYVPDSVGSERCINAASARYLLSIDARREAAKAKISSGKIEALAFLTEFDRIFSYEEQEKLLTEKLGLRPGQLKTLSCGHSEAFWQEPFLSQFVEGVVKFYQNQQNSSSVSFDNVISLRR